MKIKDQELLKNTKKLVAKERLLLTQILQHLREIESRRLYTNLKYNSLFSYCVKELNYSESQAQRRIEAMRLMKAMPEVEKKLETGKISLTNAASVQSFFRQESITGKTQKQKILKKLEQKSTRQANQVFQQFSKTPEKYERRIEIKVSEKLEQKINTVKGLMAHKNPFGSLEQIFEELCDQYIALKNPAFKQLKRKEKLDSLSAKKRNVWRKAESKCEKCGSQYALEVDHIRPRAFGGGDEQRNLRLLCRKCNQRAAIEQLGMHRCRVFWISLDNKVLFIRGCF